MKNINNAAGEEFTYFESDFLIEFSIINPDDISKPTEAEHLLELVKVAEPIEEISDE